MNFFSDLDELDRQRRRKHEQGQFLARSGWSRDQNEAC